MKCVVEGCKEDVMFKDFCGDHEPGYNLCKACDDYRCEHISPTEEDLKDPEFFSCHCENAECRAGFVEGSDRKIVSLAMGRKLMRSWGRDVPEPNN